MLPNNSIINKLLYLLVVQLIPICATAQSSGMNYIQTKTFLDEEPVPPSLGTETGNAVDNENIVRKELNLQEREKDVNHVE